MRAHHFDELERVGYGVLQADVAGRDAETLFSNNLSRLIAGGFLALATQRLVATAAGRQRLNAVLAALLC